MNVLTPVLTPMRRRSSALTAPSVRIQFPSSTRERIAEHSGHIAIFTLVELVSRAIRRVSSVRELRPEVRRQPDQLDRERRDQVGILASELARDLVHDVVDQLEEVDADLGALNQLLHLAGCRHAGGSRRFTCTRPLAAGLMPIPP